MTCKDYKHLMMGFLDGELDEQQKLAFEKHLESCEVCRGELEEFKQLKKITDGVDLAEPEDAMWEHYWSGIYNRIERSMGWLLFSVAGALLLIYGGFKAIEEIIKDPTVDMVLKIGLIGLIGGLAILLVSVFRERLYFRKKNRYKDIRR